MSGAIPAELSIWPNLLRRGSNCGGTKIIRKLSVRDLDLGGKRVFMRVDFNVPIQGNRGRRTIPEYRAALPTIQLAKAAGARVILASHLGRPKGESKPEFSLRPVAGRLSEILGEEVLFAADCVGEEARRAVEELAPGGVLLLENVRFTTVKRRMIPSLRGRWPV